MPELTDIFFDLDGTLTNSQEGILKCYRYSLEKMGQSNRCEKITRELIGPSLRKGLAEVLNTEDQHLIELAVGYYRERYTETGIYEQQVYPGMMELLQWLKNSPIKLHVLTIKPEVFANRIIEHFFPGIFNGIYGTTLNGHFDNKVEHMEYLLSDLELDPEATLMIGDRREDILAGKVNLTRTIGVTYGFGSRREVYDSIPDYICNCPAEIQDVILRIQGKLPPTN